MTAAPVPRSLVWATDIDVLPPGRVVERRDGYVVVRSPANPTHYWGNLLLFDDPPAPGDRERWEALFATEFAGQPASDHITFGWDRCDGELGAAGSEFAAHGYELEHNTGLVAAPAQIRHHPRANRDVEVRRLDPRPEADAALWDAVVELQVTGRDTARFPAEAPQRAFYTARIRELRQMFCAGGGGWYVAIDPAAGAAGVVGSLGIVVTSGRARFQAVDTVPSHRRRGICTRLVVDGARDAEERHGARQLVIVADPGYHAMSIYESVGFVRAETAAGVCLVPARARVADGGHHPA